jgi:hypothetical protein
MPLRENFGTTVQKRNHNTHISPGKKKKWAIPEKRRFEVEQRSYK